MIYTSYFSKFNKVKQMGKKCISIARFTPRDVYMPSYLSLAPTYEILREWKKNEDIDRYIDRYVDEILSKLSPEKVYADLDECVLFCYERSDSFCHRHLVAEWLRFYGFECDELHL